MEALDIHIKDALGKRLDDLEKYFDADVITIYGSLMPGVEKALRNFLEGLKEDYSSNSRLVVFLKTPGGVAESVENIVGIMRFHYSHLIFVVPDYAMSAGTILCMAGNEIYMDYASSLGPIDPQVVIGDSLVPALGYLEQYETMIEKSRHGDLTDAEFLLLNQQDLAVLHSIEQAKELTITLLKKWLVEHKFSNWDVHRTDKDKKGQKVTRQEKEERAKEIASGLSNIRKWHSHNRAIGIEALTKELRLQIEDYSKNQGLRTLIRDYFDLLVAYIERHNFSFFLHSRIHF